MKDRSRRLACLWKLESWNCVPYGHSMRYIPEIRASVPKSEHCSEQANVFDAGLLWIFLLYHLESGTYPTIQSSPIDVRVIEN
jgi:hypothetical protein